MRKPFKAGRFRLEPWGPDSLSWLLWVSPSHGLDIGCRCPYTDADLRHINRITAKALKYRARGKAKPG